MEELPTVLLVDDDEGDVFLFQRAATTAGIQVQFAIAHNGLEAVNYLLRSCDKKSPGRPPVPKFIITDNRMPVMSGREFLAWLRAHPECSVIPTVVFGGGDSPHDVQEAYDHGAHSFFVKPNDPMVMVELVKLIFRYWENARVPVRKET